MTTKAKHRFGAKTGNVISHRPQPWRAQYMRVRAMILLLWTWAVYYLCSRKDKNAHGYMFLRLIKLKWDLRISWRWERLHARQVRQNPEVYGFTEAPYKVERWKAKA